MDAPSRAWIYQQLADVFDGVFAVPDTGPQTAGTPSEPAIAAAIERFRAALCNVVHEEAAVEHARLFVNAPAGVAAPPYASFYLDRRLLGPTTLRVAAAYEAQGLAPDPDAHEPADYISAELEFMYFLIRHEIAAHATADAAALDAVRSAQAAFVLEHLARWLPAFIARIREARPQPPFGAAATLLEALAAADANDLRHEGSKPSATADSARNRSFHATGRSAEHCVAGESPGSSG
jgi:putative dimethyl sulfoxide reductase chaperone